MRDGHHGGADPYCTKWRCAVQGRGPGPGCAGCWSLDGVPHREHCSPGASTPCPTMPPLPYLPSPSPPLATRTAALESSEAVLITREIRRNFQPGNMYSISCDGFTVAPLIHTIQNVAAASILEDPDRHLAIRPEIGGIKGIIIDFRIRTCLNSRLPASSTRSP
jgi:hypothetical protein